MRPGDINLAEPATILAADGPPHDYFTALRREAPVFFNPPPDNPGDGALTVKRGFWVISKHEHVSQISHDPTTFSSWLGAPVIWDVEDDPVIGLEGHRAGLMGQDPPNHTKLRKLVQPGFSPKIIATLEGKIREHAQRIVRAAREMEEFDLVADLAAELPVIMLCELMGIPETDWPKIFEWGNAVANPEDPSGRNIEAAGELFAYCHELVAQKRASPDGTAMSVYATTPVDGALLSDPEISLFFLTLSIAGHETTRNTTVHTLRLFHEHPEQLALVEADIEGRLPNAIDEVLRFSPPVMQFRRTATRSATIGSTTIEQGDKVYLAYASANRDEDVFTRSQELDVLRPNAKRHLSFGLGTHFCMGAPLARMQLRCLLEEVMRTMPRLEPAGPPDRLPSIWFNGYRSVPVRVAA